MARVVLEISRKGDVQRAQWEADGITYSDVVQVISAVCPDVQEYSAKYLDDDGDICTLVEGTFPDFMTVCMKRASEAGVPLSLMLIDSSTSSCIKGGFLGLCKRALGIGRQESCSQSSDGTRSLPGLYQNGRTTAPVRIRKAIPRQSKTRRGKPAMATENGETIWRMDTKFHQAGLQGGEHTKLEKPYIRIGTRGSPLALAQANLTKKLLQDAWPEMSLEGAIEIEVISTTGDERLDISLAEIGGKGLFTKELDVKLVNKDVDICVHSTKDVPTVLPPNTELAAILKREDTRDAIITPDDKIKRLEDFPDGSVIGTASLRRQAQIYAVNPNVKCVNFRGNVQTRLKKLAAGEVDGTLLAYAGLKRMSMEEHASEILEWDEMLPAIAQGAISIQCRSDDDQTINYLRRLDDPDTRAAVICERAFLAALDGNCKTPIAGQAFILDGKLRFRGLVSSPDGKQVFRAAGEGFPKDCEEIGHAAGMEIRKEAGESFFEEMQKYVQEIQAANTRPTKSSA